MSNRDVYVQMMKAKLDEWNAQMDRLAAQAEAAEAEAKLRYRAQLDALEKQRDEARARLGKLQTASEEAWQSMQKGMEAAWESMSQAMKDAASRFK